MNRTNTILTVLLAVTSLMIATSHTDFTRPNVEILPDMKYSPAASTYSPSSVLPHGRTLQPPVPGTIARGQVVLHYTASKEDALRAGEELDNPTTTATNDPIDKMAQSVERGGNTFRVFCIACHGATGEGDGPVARRGFPPPPSLLTGNSRTMKDGQLFHIVTFGQGSMAGFAGQLSHEQRWDIVNFVRRLQSTSAAVTEVDPAAPMPSDDKPDLPKDAASPD